jgi:hypothetical protein
MRCSGPAEPPATPSSATRHRASSHGGWQVPRANRPARSVTQPDSESVAIRSTWRGCGRPFAGHARVDIEGLKYRIHHVKRVRHPVAIVPPGRYLVMAVLDLAQGNADGITWTRSSTTRPGPSPSSRTSRLRGGQTPLPHAGAWPLAHLGVADLLRAPVRALPAVLHHHARRADRGHRTHSRSAAYHPTTEQSPRSSSRTCRASSDTDP